MRTASAQSDKMGVVGGIKKPCGVEEGSRPLLSNTPELQKVVNTPGFKEVQAGFLEMS